MLAAPRYLLVYSHLYGHHPMANSNCSISYVIYLVVFMALSNSAINPCICLIFSRNYRKELKALFK